MDLVNLTQIHKIKFPCKKVLAKFYYEENIYYLYKYILSRHIHFNLVKNHVKTTQFEQFNYPVKS